MLAWSQKWIPFVHGRCPGEQTLAAYADHQLLGSERQSIEKHLSKCDRCIQQVGFLASAQGASHEVPAALLQAALDRTSRRPVPTGHFLNPGIPVFSAALILLAIFLIWELRGNRTRSVVPPSQFVARQTPPPPPMPGTPAPQSLVRGAPENTKSPLLSPLPKEHVASADLEFRWQPQPRVSFYELRLVSDSGAVVWEGRADATVKSIRLPARIRLQTGGTYYAWLRVHLDSGALRQFDPVQFVAGE